MGLKRNLDPLGRVTIPAETRRELNLNFGDEVDIEIKENQVIITNPKLKTIKSKKEIEDKITRVKSMEDYQDNIIAHGFITGLKWVINEGIEDVL